MSKRIKATELFYDILRKNGINKIFGNPGTTEMSFINAINENNDFEYILALQESTAIGMAAGYAIGTNKPAFVNLHTYCGMSNGMCNIFNAMSYNAPLIITAGQQHRKMLAYNPVLSGPLVDLVRSSVKTAEEVQQNYDLGIKLQRAINIAQNYPIGPTFVSLPMDIFQEEVTYHHDIGIPHSPTQHGSISSSEWSILEETIGTKQKIALLLDQEAHEAYYELIKLAELMVADVYHSSYVNRQVFDTAHFLFKGAISSSIVDQNKLFEKYDVLFLIGKQFCWSLYSEGNPIPEKLKVIHLNNSQDGIKHNVRTDYSFVGDIQKSIASLNLFLETIINRENQKKALQSKKEDYEKQAKKENNYFSSKNQYNEKGLDPYSIIYHALEAFPNNFSITVEPSSEMHKIAKMAKRSDPNCIFYAPRGAGLGWAMPFSIGLSMAKNEPVLCFVGDGGSIYAIQSIYSAFKYKIPIIYVCFENRSYHILKELGMIQDPKFNKKFVGMDFEEQELDLLKIVEGFGGIAYKVNSYEELRETIKNNVGVKKPVWISVPTLSKLFTMFK